MASKKFFTKDRVYPLAVVGVVLLVVLFALLLSGNGLNRFLSPMSGGSGGNPNIVLKAADNSDITDHNKTLINVLFDAPGNIQTPGYDESDVSNEIVRTPIAGKPDELDMFRIQGQILKNP